MRQREITWQGWRVTWSDVDGGRHTFTADECVDADYEAAALRKRGVADVRVRPVTRYRLAPLVEIAAWRTAHGGASVGKPWLGTGAYVSGCRGDWAATAVANGLEVSSHNHRTKAAAMAAAEAHLAVLGYRVKKEKRR